MSLVRAVLKRRLAMWALVLFVAVPFPFIDQPVGSPAKVLALTAMAALGYLSTLSIALMGIIRYRANATKGYLVRVAWNLLPHCRREVGVGLGFATFC
jgi:hypothetical protein